MKTIFLCGFMGSGKTSVGKKLARNLDCPFLDTDAELEKKLGKSVAQIFDDEGETYFRLHENAFIRQLCSASENGVIALGGGSLMDDDNVNLILSAGPLVYLQTTIQEITRRIGVDPTRPLLKTDNLEGLLADRISGYSKASVVVSTDGLSEDGVAKEIARALGLS